MRRCLCLVLVLTSLDGSFSHPQGDFGEKLPSVQRLVAQHSLQNIVAQPSTQNKFAQQPRQNIVAQPSTQNIVAQPSTQNKFAQQPRQNIVTQPLSQHKFVQQSIQHIVAQPLTHNKVTQQSIHNVVAQPSIQNIVVQPSIQDISAQPSTQNKVTQQSIRNIEAQPQLQHDPASDPLDYLSGPLPAAPHGPVSPIKPNDDRQECSRSGFSVRKASRSTLVAKTQIEFQEVLTNAGGWDSKANVFTAFCPGIYFFTFNAVSDNTKDFTIALMKNEKYQVTGYGGKEGYHWGSNSALLFLNPGDIVYLELQDGAIYEHPYNEAYTTFTGFLVNRI